jgi:hypothetical protein
MDIDELKQIIEKIAADKRLDPEELMDELAEIAKLKYGATLVEKERMIIDEVKNKILTRLYNTHEHRIDKLESDEIKHYRLDGLEAKYLDSALEELVGEGLARSDRGETSLTDAGILKYKQFYGEI